MQQNINAMIKRNRYKKEPDKLTLYPDYGNLNFFIVLSCLCIPFIYALYWVDAQHHNIGAANMLYIIAGILLLLLLGFVSAFKK